MNGMRKDVIAKIDEDVLTCLSRINHPSFNTHADVTHKEILEVDATAPGVIGFEIAVIFPIVSCKDVGAPQTNVKFSVRVPLRARWRSSYLFHFFPGILSAGKSGRSD